MSAERDDLIARFEAIATNSGHGANPAALRELREIAFRLGPMLTGSAYARQNLEAALGWAGILFSPRRWQRWAGGAKEVRGFILADVFRVRSGMRAVENASVDRD